jgi:hypothetical protein
LGVIKVDASKNNFSTIAEARAVSHPLRTRRRLCPQGRLSANFNGRRGMSANLTTTELFWSGTSDWLKSIGRNKKWLAENLGISGSSLSYMMNEAKSLDSEIKEAVRKLQGVNASQSSPIQLIKKSSRYLSETSKLNDELISALEDNHIDAAEKSVLTASLDKLIAEAQNLKNILEGM